MAADQGVRYCSACGKYHTADAANALICPNCGNSAAQPINNASMNPSSSQPPVPNRDVPNQGVRYCNACGASNPQDGRFCNKCGQSLVEQGNAPQGRMTANQGMRYCGSCGKPNALGARFCRFCGDAIVDDASDSDTFPTQPAGSKPSPYAAQSSPPYIPPPITPVSQTNNPVGTIMIVLLVVLGLWWLGLGLLQVVEGLNSGVNDPTLWGVGVWNIVISIFNLWSIRDVVHRYRRTVRTMCNLAIFGTIFGLVQVFAFNAYVQILVVPLYISSSSQ